MPFLSEFERVTGQESSLTIQQQKNLVIVEGAGWTHPNAGTGFYNQACRDGSASDVSCQLNVDPDSVLRVHLRPSRPSTHLNQPRSHTSNSSSPSQHGRLLAPISSSIVSQFGPAWPKKAVRYAAFYGFLPHNLSRTCADTACVIARLDAGR